MTRSELQAKALRQILAVIPYSKIDVVMGSLIVGIAIEALHGREFADGVIEEACGLFEGGLFEWRATQARGARSTTNGGTN